MPMNQGKGWTFNTMADTYEKIRPGYPEELYPYYGLDVEGIVKTATEFLK